VSDGRLVGLVGQYGEGRVAEDPGGEKAVAVVLGGEEVSRHVATTGIAEVVKCPLLGERRSPGRRCRTR
jgi:hypothetical protein